MSHSRRQQYDPATETTLDQWVAAKRAKNYAVTDSLRAELRTKGIEPDSARPSERDLALSSGAAPSRFGASQAAVAPRYDPAIEAKLDRWVAAKREKDFRTADALRAELRTHGIDPDSARPSERDRDTNQAVGGQTRSWSSAAPPPGPTFGYGSGGLGGLAGAPPPRTADPSVEAKLDRWVQAKREKDFTAADAIRTDLRSFGIEPEFYRSSDRDTPGVASAGAPSMLGAMSQAVSLATPPRAYNLAGSRFDPNVEAKLERWVAAKREKDFTAADAIRAELRAYGIEPDTVRPPDRELGSIPIAPDVQAQLDRWVLAKREKDFSLADSIRSELRLVGIEPDVVRPADRVDPPGSPTTPAALLGASGFGPAMFAGSRFDPATEEKLERWVLAKRDKDWATADTLRSEFRAMGIEPDLVRPPDRELVGGASTAVLDPAVESKLDRWVLAKREKDWAKADSIRSELRTVGIEPDHLRPPDQHVPVGRGAGGLDHDTEAQLDRWVQAKRDKDFSTADRIRGELRANGIEPDSLRPSDRELTQQQQQQLGQQQLQVLQQSPSTIFAQVPTFPQTIAAYPAAYPWAHQNQMAATAPGWSYVDSIMAAQAAQAFAYQAHMPQVLTPQMVPQVMPVHQPGPAAFFGQVPPPQMAPPTGPPMMSPPMAPPPGPVAFLGQSPPPTAPAFFGQSLQVLSAQALLPAPTSQVYDAETEVLLDRWVGAKREKDFMTADSMRSQLRAKGIEPDVARPSDKAVGDMAALPPQQSSPLLQPGMAPSADPRGWGYGSSSGLFPGQVPTQIAQPALPGTAWNGLRHAAPRQYDAETESQLDRWVLAKREKEFSMADSLRSQLRAKGIEPDTARPSDKKLREMAESAPLLSTSAPVMLAAPSASAELAALGLSPGLQREVERQLDRWAEAWRAGDVATAELVHHQLQSRGVDPEKLRPQQCQPGVASSLAIADSGSAAPALAGSTVASSPSSAPSTAAAPASVGAAVPPPSAHGGSAEAADAPVAALPADGLPAGPGAAVAVGSDTSVAPDASAAPMVADVEAIAPGASPVVPVSRGGAASSEPTVALPSFNLDDEDATAKALLGSSWQSGGSAGSTAQVDSSGRAGTRNSPSPSLAANRATEEAAAQAADRSRSRSRDRRAEERREDSGEAQKSAEKAAEEHSDCKEDQLVEKGIAKREESAVLEPGAKSEDSSEATDIEKIPEQRADCKEEQPFEQGSAREGRSAAPEQGAKAEDGKEPIVEESRSEDPAKRTEVAEEKQRRQEELKEKERRDEEIAREGERERERERERELERERGRERERQKRECEREQEREKERQHEREREREREKEREKERERERAKAAEKDEVGRTLPAEEAGIEAEVEAETEEGSEQRERSPGKGPEGHVAGQTEQKSFQKQEAQLKKKQKPKAKPKPEAKQEPEEKLQQRSEEKLHGRSVEKLQQRSEEKLHRSSFEKPPAEIGEEAQQKPEEKLEQRSEEKLQQISEEKLQQRSEQKFEQRSEEKLYRDGKKSSSRKLKKSSSRDRSEKKGKDDKNKEKESEASKNKGGKDNKYKHKKDKSSSSSRQSRWQK
eukprot:CAMPEP_0203889566 /NCGR_PEP_ID=MMETSP0359-20131031/33108_1 /ASSEMBLY_ACC=CAM_ASM_000338 /TAXON_ID=268821 /ORGANISM="Scrippsiella Hangoei, Strain SHTV-5" /LENGTH=1572 /DNA_ID=CAMNT_0050811013 /DNA_START=25 /DNA_END=4746 /DNA_ORIENTATION=-